MNAPITPENKALIEGSGEYESEKNVTTMLTAQAVETRAINTVLVLGILT
ncbi:MAG: hypothetical protein M3N43_06440 [Actinomycetota bacterium]|nr:hypothetical protein [Actinomycetota bacterium]